MGGSGRLRHFDAKSWQHELCAVPYFSFSTLPPLIECMLFLLRKEGRNKVFAFSLPVQFEYEMHIVKDVFGRHEFFP